MAHTYRVGVAGTVPVSHQLLFLSACLARPCPQAGEWYCKALRDGEAAACVVPARHAGVKRRGFDGLFFLVDLGSRGALEGLQARACPEVVVGVRYMSRGWDREVPSQEAETACRRLGAAAYLELDLETGENAQAALTLLVNEMREFCEKRDPLYVRNGGIGTFNAARGLPSYAMGLFKGSRVIGRTKSSLSVSDSAATAYMGPPLDQAQLYVPGSLCHEVWVQNLSAMEKCLRAGASVDESGNVYGDTPLHFAAFLDNLSLVEFLLNKGASTYIRNSLGQSPLHIAAAHASVAVCQALVDAGNDDAATMDHTGMAPLSYALVGARLAVFKYLYGTVSDGSMAEKVGELQLLHILASSKRCTQEFLTAVLEGGFELSVDDESMDHARDDKDDEETDEHAFTNSTQDHGDGDEHVHGGSQQKPLQVAASFGNMTAFRVFLLRSSADSVREAFVEAAREGQLEVMELVWEASHRDKYFPLSTPLAHCVAKSMAASLRACVSHNRVEVAEWLLNREKQYFVALDSDSAVLIRAVAHGMPVSVVASLLRLGVGINSTDENGMTPILAAAAHGRLRLLHTLIENGGSLFTRDARGYGALHHACGNDNLKVLEWLLDLGLNPNEHNRFGESPIMVAVGQANEGALRLVLAHVEHRPPQDPLGTLKLWPKGVFFQAVIELREEDFVNRKVLHYPGLQNKRVEYLSGTYMGIQVLAQRYLAPVDTQEIAHHLSLQGHLRHRNLLTLLGICSDGACYTLLFEVPGNAPVCWLSSAIRQRWSGGAIILLLKSLLRGLEAMHREGAGKAIILHRNLHSSSIMLNVKHGPIVCNFSESALSSRLGSLAVSGCVGPHGWRPPECHSGMNFDEKSDVFGFACILYELLHGKFPFAQYHLFDIPRHIMAGDRPKLRTATTPEDEILMDVLQSCWAQNPEDRPTFSELAARFEGFETNAQAQEDLEQLYAYALTHSTSGHSDVSSLYSNPTAQAIRYMGLCTHVSRAALGLDDGGGASVNPGPNDLITLMRVSIESSEYYARQIPMAMVRTRRLQLCQMRLLDIGQLPAASTSKHRGAKNVLRVLYLNQVEYRALLFTHRFDHVLFDLLKVMAHEKRQHWSPSEVRDMALQIALGISFLCSADPTIHHCFSDRDIFIVDEPGGRMRVMVGGFGLTHLLTAKHNWSMLGDRGFIDATLLSADAHLFNTVMDRNHRLASEESDVFAFGMVLHTILGLKRPWDGLGEVDANDCVLQGLSLEPLALSSGYKVLQDLSKDCINPLRHRRPKLRRVIARLDAMTSLSTARDKYRPRLNRGRNSFQQPVVSGNDRVDRSEASVSFSHISLPRSKLGPSGLLLLKSDKFKSECGAFLVSASSSEDRSEMLEQDVALEDYTTAFSSLPHCVMYGVGPGGPVLICISKAKEKYMDEPVYRVLIRSQSGDERCYIPASTKLLMPKKGQEGTPPSAAQLLGALRIINVKFDKCNFSVVRELASKNEASLLADFEKSTVSKTYSFGVIYAKAGQMALTEMLANETSPEFDAFLKSIGDVCKLNGFSRFSGGLDTKYDSTGVHSVYSRSRDCEIMFHVGPMLPDDASSMRMRTRFLSQSVSLIVFQEEGSAPLSPVIFSDWPMVHVIIVVRPVTARTKAQARDAALPIESFAHKQSKVAKAYYQVAVASHHAVQPFGPHLENPVFERGLYFRSWLLAKLINGQRSGYRSETKLRAKMEVSRATKLSQVERKMQVMEESK